MVDARIYSIIMENIETIQECVVDNKIALVTIAIISKYIVTKVNSVFYFDFDSKVVSVLILELSVTCN